MTIFNALIGTNSINSTYAGIFGPMGSTSKVNMPVSTSLNFGTTNDFTVECWAYATSYSDLNCLGSASAQPSVIARFDRRYTPPVWYFSIVSGLSISRENPPLNTWFHISVSRESGWGYVHYNGTQIGAISGSSTNVSFSGGSAIIGNYNNNTDQEWVGYISQFRISNVARYTRASIFVPNLTLSKDSNTVLLTCNSNTFRDTGNLNLGTLSTVGSPSIVRTNIIR